MKVISGRFKGRILHSPDNSNVRPTSAKVKEAVFGKIQFLIADSSFLDLFSGSGAMGIEALSRGTSEVVFNDKSRKSCEFIKNNLKLIGEDCLVLNYDYSKALKMLVNREFNLIYADPPYGIDCLDEVLEISYQYNVLAVGGMMIYEHNSNNPLNYNNNHYIIIDNKLYATTTITYLKRID